MLTAIHSKWITALSATLSQNVPLQLRPRHNHHIVELVQPDIYILKTLQPKYIKFLLFLIDICHKEKTEKTGKYRLQSAISKARWFVRLCEEALKTFIYIIPNFFTLDEKHVERRMTLRVIAPNYRDKTDVYEWCNGILDSFTQIVNLPAITHKETRCVQCKILN